MQAYHPDLLSLANLLFRVALLYVGHAYLTASSCNGLSSCTSLFSLVHPTSSTHSSLISYLSSLILPASPPPNPPTVKQDGGVDVFEMQIALAGAASNMTAAKR